MKGGRAKVSWNLVDFKVSGPISFFFGSYQYYQVKEREKKNGEEGQDPIQ